MNHCHRMLTHSSDLVQHFCFSNSLNESQAVAARGQIELMTAWKNEFKKYKKQVAQILLSPSDIKNKKSSKNAIAI